MSKTIHITSASQLDQLLKSNTVVVVDFFATWCGPCKAISPAYEALASKLSESGKMAFAKVDVDQNQDIAQANNVTAMPTFILYKDASEAERVRGADPTKLTNLVRTLLAEAGGSAIASGSGSWTAAEIPKGYKNINSEIDVKGLDCMNWKSDLGSNIKSLFDASGPSALTTPGGGSSSSGKGKAKAADSSNSADWVESDTDDQLMLFIPFQSTVKVFGLQITSLPPPLEEDEEDDDELPSRPKTIKIYANNAHILGFDEAESRTELQLVELDEADWKDGTAVVNLRFVKFQAVSTLTIFVVAAEGGKESVRIDRIRIIGESGEKKDLGKLEKVGEEH